MAITSKVNGTETGFISQAKESEITRRYEKVWYDGGRYTSLWQILTDLRQDSPIRSCFINLAVNLVVLFFKRMVAFS